MVGSQTKLYVSLVYVFDMITPSTHSAVKATTKTTDLRLIIENNLTHFYLALSSVCVLALQYWPTYNKYIVFYSFIVSICWLQKKK